VAGVATVAGAPAPAGEGVAGTAVAVLDDCVGAAGGAGVEAGAGAGVEGAFDEDAAAGVALGCRRLENDQDMEKLISIPFGPCRR
jgi:hypothetical protein